MITRWEIPRGTTVAESESGDYILHTDHAEAMAGKDAEVERLREALKLIAEKFGSKERAKLEEWEGCGTEAFSDPDWVWASDAKVFHNIAAAALSGKDTPMPTPNIPDEVVDVAKATFYANSGIGDAMRRALEAALPLLLVDSGERQYCLGPNGEYHEPLYRLKVSK